METFSGLVALCDGNLRLKKWVSKQWDAGDLRRHRANYDLSLLIAIIFADFMRCVSTVIDTHMSIAIVFPSASLVVVARSKV